MISVESKKAKSESRSVIRIGTKYYLLIGNRRTFFMTGFLSLCLSTQNACFS